MEALLEHLPINTTSLHGTSPQLRSTLNRKKALKTNIYIYMKIREEEGKMRSRRTRENIGFPVFLLCVDSFVSLWAPSSMALHTGRNMSKRALTEGALGNQDPKVRRPSARSAGSRAFLALQAKGRLIWDPDFPGPPPLGPLLADSEPDWRRESVEALCTEKST